MRNPFFLPSGFEPQEQINILEAKSENKKRLDKIKERKRAEKKLLNTIKHGKCPELYKKVIKLSKTMDNCNKCKPPKKSTKTYRIQYGFDLAKWWGEQHGL